MFSVAAVIFILYLAPYACGILLKRFHTGQKLSWLYLWTRGAVLEFALFGISFLVYRTLFSYRLNVHAVLFLSVLGIVAVLAVVSEICGRTEGHVKKRRFELLDIFPFLAVCVFGGILICLGLSGNLWMTSDITPEMMNSILQSNTVGETNPYTGGIYAAGAEKVYESVLVVFWTFISFVSGIEPSVLLEVCVFPFLMLLFYTFCFETGLSFFKRSKADAVWFSVAILCLQLLGARREWLLFYPLTHGPWQGESVMAFFLLPLLILELCRLGMQKGRTVRSIVSVGAVIVTAMACEAGWFYLIIIGVLTGAVYLGRTIWKC